MNFATFGEKRSSIFLAKAPTTMHAWSRKTPPIPICARLGKTEALVFSLRQS
ncbi:hypothetical protein Sjap_019780 [Stephania japonica]|uniref:Uncharacterized protein n=1 Tax=Stephania japonica TaxID=461633 RepID=A0AAP0HZP2_9MAGN